MMIDLLCSQPRPSAAQRITTDEAFPTLPTVQEAAAKSKAEVGTLLKLKEQLTKAEEA